MELFPRHITLNGQQTEVVKLLQNRDKNTGWKKEWLDFLEEWYNPADFIEVNTSGSTGEPKTIRLKKEFVAESALRTIRFFNLKEGDKVLHCLPSRYIAGKLMVVRALLGKLDLYVVDPAGNFEVLKTMPFKFAAMVVNQVQKCLEFDRWNLDFLLIGGSAIPAPLEEKLQQVTATCYSSYAMTETATHIALRKLNGEAKDNCYHCLDNIEVSLSDNGCLQVFMPGLEQAFLQTTDLAELTDKKTFKILGRVDHVIISGGIKYSPELLEKKLEPFINQPFFITSLPHDTLGQQLVLVVEGTENIVLKNELKKVCIQQLSQYEQPRRILFTRELPHTPNGKLNRNGLTKPNSVSE